MINFLDLLSISLKFLITIFCASFIIKFLFFLQDIPDLVGAICLGYMDKPFLTQRV